MLGVFFQRFGHRGVNGDREEVSKAEAERKGFGEPNQNPARRRYCHRREDRAPSQDHQRPGRCSIQRYSPRSLAPVLGTWELEAPWDSPRKQT